jgi:hypothetical protein
MTGRRAIASLCMLSALAFSAFGAQTAGAATNGTTAFTCRNVGGTSGGFTKAHCKEADKGAGAFAHMAIAEDTTTELIGTNEKTGSDTNTTTIWRLKDVTAGIILEFQATGVSATGSMTNKKAGNGEHLAAGTGQIRFAGVTVTAPVGKGCKVKGGEIVTNTLEATTAGQGMGVKFTPLAGEVLAKFEVEGCVAPLNIHFNTTYEVKGSVVGTPDGATINFTHAGTTAQGTLFLNGQKAGIEGSMTVSGRDPNLGESLYTPLSPITVET